MKIISKLFLIVFLIQVSSLSAQDSYLRFGVNAGTNFSNSSFNKDDMDKKPKLGLQLGVTLDYVLYNGCYLQSGLSFTTKGAKFEGVEDWIPSGETQWKQTVNMQYLQIPILAGYKFNITDDTEFFFQLGSYIAYGIGGKSVLENKYVNLSTEDSKEEFDTFGKNGLNRFDYGLAGGFGAEYNKVFISVNYELGLRNLNNSDEKENDTNNITKPLYADRSFRIRNVALMVGYKF